MKTDDGHPSYIGHFKLLVLVDWINTLLNTLFDLSGVIVRVGASVKSL